MIIYHINNVTNVVKLCLSSVQIHVGGYRIGPINRPDIFADLIVVLHTNPSAQNFNKLCVMCDYNQLKVSLRFPAANNSAKKELAS